LGVSDLIRQPLQAERQYLEDTVAAAAAEKLALEREAAALEAERQIKERRHIIQESPELRGLKQLIDVSGPPPPSPPPTAPLFSLPPS